MKIFAGSFMILFWTLLIIATIVFISKPRPFMRIYDCFTFKDEFKMLDLRLYELGPYVDAFVLVESAHTFKGDRKPLYFSEHGATYLGRNPYFHKIRTVVHSQEPDKNPWVNEKNQRNAIMKGIIDARPDDVVIVADVDEIVNPDILKKIRKNGMKKHMYKLKMDLYCYDMRHKLTEPWYHTKLARYKSLAQSSPDEMRWRSDVDYYPMFGGWHLSYFMSPEEISKKIQDFSHQEYNNSSFTDSSIIQSKIQNHQTATSGDKLTVVDPKSQIRPIHVDRIFPS
jgi:beta-1,4-mannosyl-glycoprotein beta-1,4-N-acetylglucosaminyltransferase